MERCWRSKQLRSFLLQYLRISYSRSAGGRLYSEIITWKRWIHARENITEVDNRAFFFLFAVNRWEADDEMPA